MLLKDGTGNREKEFGNEFTAVIPSKIPLYFDFCMVYNFIELMLAERITSQFRYSRKVDFEYSPRNTFPRDLAYRQY